MRVVAVIVAVAVMAGCAPVTSNTVQVPVPVPCEVPDIPTPALPVDDVAPDADIFTVARALWASLERLEAHVDQLRTVAGACRAK